MRVPVVTVVLAVYAYFLLLIFGSAVAIDANEDVPMSTALPQGDSLEMLALMIKWPRSVHTKKCSQYFFSAMLCPYDINYCRIASWPPSTDGTSLYIMKVTSHWIMMAYSKDVE